MSNRKGFTLIELLIVVVIIGILAAIAIPKFANTKQKAVKSSMISDLRNLATAQEAWYADSTYYASTYQTTPATTAFSFAPSKDNVLAFEGASASGWAVTVTNPGYNNGNSKCGIYVGSAFSGSTGISGINEGVPTCE
ncbi:MAG TPA: prepilin-type N-terminal cleavage/methylation domain-containing protein [Gemmatimonadales bacterium]|nr:prepilin-type N-terminal cleavage/methylation domain-containing protein [Gemmatimonadales bacterium]